MKRPIVDRLAAKGMIFTNGLCNSAVCSPFTSQGIFDCAIVANHRHPDWIGAPEGEGLGDHIKRFFKNYYPKLIAHALQEFITIPEAFKGEGYKTFFAGKNGIWAAKKKIASYSITDFEIIKEVLLWVSPAKRAVFRSFFNPYLEDLRRKKVLNLSMKWLMKHPRLYLQQNQESEFFLALVEFLLPSSRPDTNFEREWNQLFTGKSRSKEGR